MSDLQDAAGRGEQLPRPSDVPPPLPPRVSALVDEALAASLRRCRGEETALRTPWSSVNEHLFGGLWPGLYTLTSSTGIGKTQAALQCAIRAAQHVRKERDGSQGPDDGTGEVLYVALELGAVDVGARTIGLLSETDRAPIAWRDVFFGRVSPDELSHLGARYREDLEGLPLRVACVSPRAGHSGVLAVRRPGELANVAARMKPRFLLLDYAQLLQGEDERDDVRQAIKDVSIIGREIARGTLGGPPAAVLFISSTARSNYALLTGEEGPLPGTGDPERLVGLGKEAGELEYCADAALALAKDPTDALEEGEKPRDRTIWLAIAKGRGFEKAWIPLWWNGWRFRSMDPADASNARKRVREAEAARGRPRRREIDNASSSGDARAAKNGHTAPPRGPIE